MRLSCATRTALFTACRDDEVLRRQRFHGLNELAGDDKEPLWKKFVDKLKEPMIMMLGASAAISLFMRQFDDAISIFAVCSVWFVTRDSCSIVHRLPLQSVAIVISVAVFQEYKSDQSLEALSKLAPPHCRVLRGGIVADVDASSLVPGDIVVLAVGDRVPADLRLLAAVDLAIDESSLTGENEPVAKVSSHGALLQRSFGEGSGGSRDAVVTIAPVGSPLPAATPLPVAERTNCAFMGTLVRAGRGSGVVVATAMSTELGHVCAILDKADERKSPLQTRMDELGQRLTTISFGIIGCIVLHGIAFGRKGVLDMFTVGVSLAVAAIPEGLPIVVTVTLALGVQVRPFAGGGEERGRLGVQMRPPQLPGFPLPVSLPTHHARRLAARVQRMASRQAVVKKLPSVESLGCASVICVDKTGTLTQNEMTVVEAYSPVPPPSHSVVGAALDGGGASDAAADHAPGSRVLFHGLGYATRGQDCFATYNEGGSGGGRHSAAAAAAALEVGSAAARVSAADSPHVALLAEVGVVCNNATLAEGGGAIIGQPTEGALLVAAAKVGAPSAAWVRVEEQSFSSDTKWMAVRAHTAAAAAATAPQMWYFVKGSVEAVLGLCDATVAPQGTSGGSASAAAALVASTPPPAPLPGRGSAMGGSPAARDVASPGFVVAPLTPGAAEAALAAAAAMSREGLRVLALAKGVRAPGALTGGGAAPAAACGMVFVGLVGLHDPPRAGVVESVRTLRAGGVRVCMITGDSRPTAIAIAAHLGLIDEDGGDGGDRASAAAGGLSEVAVDVLAARGCALSGSEIEVLSSDALAAVVANPMLSVFYRTTPHHKMRICQAFQACGLVCAMTGDVRLTNPCECVPAALCFHVCPSVCPGRQRRTGAQGRRYWRRHGPRRY